MKIWFVARNPHRGIAVVLCACAAACLAVHADCIDELMPRPMNVKRHSASNGRNAVRAPLKTPVGPGSYLLVVRGGKPSVHARDEEGRRYAMATFNQMKKLSEADGTAIPDCEIYDKPEFKYRGLMLDCGRN